MKAKGKGKQKYPDLNELIKKVAMTKPARMKAFQKAKEHIQTRGAFPVSINRKIARGPGADKEEDAWGLHVDIRITTALGDFVSLFETCQPRQGCRQGQSMTLTRKELEELRSFEPRLLKWMAGDAENAARFFADPIAALEAASCDLKPTLRKRLRANRQAQLASLTKKPWALVKTLKVGVATDVLQRQE